MFRIISMLFVLSIITAKASAGAVPDVVRQLADAFAQSHSEKEQLPPGRSVRDEYAHHFFLGYTHPSGGVYTQSALLQEAYTHGQAYWRDHPSERTGILSAYGYVSVEREGDWSRGFEISAFEPLGIDGERWWMTPFGNGRWSEVGLQQNHTQNSQSRVRIVGYLSPAGHYGHLGAYAHEVLVTSGVLVSAENH